jgi:putative protease
MQRKIELLAPGGDIDSIKSAILAGADAVYCGLSKFNARNRAANISLKDLQGILRLAHKHHCEVFLTLNIIILDSEIPALIKLLNRLVNTSIDGIIVQDLGLFYILSKYFKSLKIHASTQLTTHNEGQVQFLSKLNANRVNLSRELNIHEIKVLTALGLRLQMLTEVFVHGSYCLSFSGICYMSAANGANSGNRGRCSQPCRDRYVLTSAGKEFPLNLKDNSAFSDLRELFNAGVASLKIEGRIKEFEYVYTVVNAWRKQIDRFNDTNTLSDDNSAFYRVFNRDFSNGFLKGEINADMFIDNPMSYVLTHLTENSKGFSDDEIEEKQKALYDEKDQVRKYVQSQIAQFSVAKIPLEISITGQCGAPLVITLKSPNTTFEVRSEVNLASKGSEPLNHKILLSRLKAIDDTEYFIQCMEFVPDENIFLPFKELSALKNRILFILNGSKKIVSPVTLPVLERLINQNQVPRLSVLISSPKDIKTCCDAAVDLYFQLPSGFKCQKDQLLQLFTENSEIIPWFPSILIGDDYSAALEFLDQLQPKRLVTNNTGIGFEASKKGISWIAGPQLNIVNSYSLLCLKENFSCQGAFLSNEINRGQIRQIRKPKDFNLYYTIYQPVVLMTSRQCLFHQVTGCEKHKIGKSCIPQCEKTATITNMNGELFMVEKSRGNYHRVFSATNMLNTDVVADVPDHFFSFLIDLTDIKTATNPTMDKSTLISLFKQHLSGNPQATLQLKNHIQPTQNKQYESGL